MGIDSELEARRKNDRCKFVPRVAEVNIRASEWVFKVKEPPKLFGITIITKSLLAARGFGEIPGASYCKPYPLVVNFTPIKSLLLLSDILIWGFPRVCCYGFSKWRYWRCLHGRPRSGLRSGTMQTTVCTLVKAHHVLKQATHWWNHKLIASSWTLVWVVVMGSLHSMERSWRAGCHYNSIIDGWLVSSRKMTIIEWIMLQLNTRIEMKDLAEAKKLRWTVDSA